jgi:hypothetical protein
MRQASVKSSAAKRRALPDPALALPLDQSGADRV